ncbi:S-adenosyl-L-methionine-dependent methyltransferase [Daedaleopsis nitida]|nr:S-adenosyl-L-methionine-dependent methyltransferase [Daedaleopsis nitida]
MSAQLLPPSAPKGNAFHIALTRVGGIAVLLGLSLATWAYQRALEPQYGTAPTSLHIGKIVWSAAILGSFAPTVPLSSATLALAILLYALPSAAYYVAAYTASFGDPVWGPVATHLVVLLPVLSLGIAIVKALQESTQSKDEENSTPQSTITLPVCATAISSLQGLWPSVSYVAVLPDSQVFIYLGTVCAALWSIGPLLPDVTPPPSPPVAAPTAAVSNPETKNKRKKGATAKPVPAAPVAPPPLPKHYAKKSSGLSKLRVALLPVLALPFLNEKIFRAPILPHPLLEPFNHPSYPLQILYAVDSPYSGVVVVGETTAANPDEPGSIDYLRYLRAGHSLLGGVWVGPRAQAIDPNLLMEDEAGNKLGDTIYSAFVVQEAALLAAKNDPKNALIIGLGTGVAASSFMRQGIPTTLVEIDPAVYDAAKRFFGLPVPPPERLFIEDARGWVHNTSVTLKSRPTDVGRFDIVVHDCFSGGSVPAHLFTQQFWTTLKDIVTPDAIIAVNFAGKLGSDSAKAVILTLRSVFPQCRALYDSLESPDNIDDEFVNWVFFCTPSSEPFKFRKAITSEYLGSHLRRHVLSSIGEREVDISTVGADLEDDKKERYILKDMANPLSEWQNKEAIGHWKIMRSVLPKVFWETY